MARAAEAQVGIKQILTDANGDAQQAITFKDQIDGDYVVILTPQEADDEAQLSVSGKTSTGFNIEVDNATEQSAEQIDTTGNTITFNDMRQEVIDTTGNTVTFVDNRVESIDASSVTLTFWDASQEVIDTTANTITFWDNRFELIDTTGNTVTFWDGGTEVIDTTGNTCTFVDNRVEIIDTTGNTVTFTASGDTIARASGDWTAKFAAGDVIVISNSTSNNSTFTVTNVVALTMTVDGGIVDETQSVANNLTFTHQNTPTASYPTLTRSSGDWTTRFAGGDTVTISNSTSNNAAFTVASVTALVISFDYDQTITAEVQSAANNLTLVITAPTVGSTITRASGSWATTFDDGDVITITNSTSNNRAYTISTVAALVMTTTAADSVLFEAETQTTANNLTFTVADPQKNPTITRASGDWQTRFAAGDTITVSNSTSNNAAFTISSVSETIINLDVDDTLTNETQTVANNLTFVITTPTIGSTLTRASGDWTVRFAIGDQITIASTTSGNNDGAFTLTDLSATVMTFTPATDSITAEVESAATCTFTVTTPTKSPTITRASGDWRTRFEAGSQITISNSTSNNATFTILSVAATVISLIVADTITAEVQSAANNLTFLIVGGQTKKPTIVRASGTWATYFAAGDTVTVANMTGDTNEGTYTIDSISTVTMTLVLTDLLTQNAESTSATALFSISNDGITVGWVAIPVTQEF